MNLPEGGTAEQRREKWAEEFYQVSAKELGDSEPTAQQAIRHSLLKWKGYLNENLQKYNLHFAPVPFGSGSCSLCQYSKRKDVDHFEVNCQLCPIYHYKDAMAPNLNDKTCLPEYSPAYPGDDPSIKPMIRLLELVLEWQIEQDGHDEAKRFLPQEVACPPGSPGGEGIRLEDCHKLDSCGDLGGEA